MGVIHLSEEVNDQFSFLPEEALVIEIDEETMLIKSVLGNDGDHDAITYHTDSFCTHRKAIESSRFFLG